MTGFDWKSAVDTARASPESAVQAQTFLHAWNSFSKPVAVECDSGDEYVIKGMRTDLDMSRALVTEHTAARLGTLLGCPIPKVAFVELPAPLITAEPQLGHMTPGICHGLEHMKLCGDKEGIGAPRNDQNRAAYGPLSVLYGWLQAGDHQVIISSDNQDVFSVDHGLFLPGQHNWTSATLASAGPPVLDPAFAQHLTPAQIDQAIDRLARISDPVIAQVLGIVPPGWGVPDGELIALGGYLADRRDTLVARAERGLSVTSRYSIVQYIPDPVADERVNIGVVAFDDEGNWAVRDVHDWRRAERFAGLGRSSGLRAHAEELREALIVAPSPPEAIGRFVNEWRHSVQLTAPRASLRSVEDTVDSIAAKVLVGERPYVQRRKPALLRAARGSFEVALAERDLGAISDKVIASRQTVPGKLESHDLDFGLRNGHLLVAARALAFPNRRSTYIDYEISDTAWMVQDVLISKRPPGSPS